VTVGVGKEYAAALGFFLAHTRLALLRSMFGNIGGR
jgi:hypothetical protein